MNTSNQTRAFDGADTELPPVSEVTKAFNRLDSAISTTTDLSRHLGERLDPLMRPPSPTSVKNEATQMSGVPLCVGINELVSVLNDANERLRSILERLGI